MKPALSVSNSIGNKLSLLRGKSGYTQSAVADYLNIKRVMLSYYETGMREAPFDILEKLSVLYGVDLECLLDDNQEISSACLAFAMRAGDLDQSDLHAISRFKEIVMNYLKINSILISHNERID